MRHTKANQRLPNIVAMLLVVAACYGVESASAGDASPDAAWSASPQAAAALDKLAGQAVDIAPWTYVWRADRAVHEQPEAYFIPRRLERLDKVYRTLYDALPQDKLKSIFYDMPDLLQRLPPAPKGPLQAGLLWTGRVSKYQVVLNWSASAADIPSPEAVEVRAYPTSFGWFGWTVDQIMSKPVISADRRTWTYTSDPTAKMDSSYSAHVDAATEMVAVFYAAGAKKIAPPQISVIGPSIGNWKRMDVEIEWGFEPATEKAEFDGRLAADVTVLGPVTPLQGDQGTKPTGPLAWHSSSAGQARRGIVVPLLYAPDAHPGLDSRVTVWTKTSGFTFRPRDLEAGPLFIPAHGVFIAQAGDGKTARQFVAELAAANRKSLCQMIRERREAASWDELLREVRLWTCPAGTPVPPFPQVPDPPMQVELSDARWTAAWRAASAQLQGKHMWGNLAFEVGRVAHEMDMIGLHKEADKVYRHFLASPGRKPDGDYSDGTGALEWATAMRHDMGYSHDGTHASTGRLLFAMADRYFLTGDREWFQKNMVRLQAAADWIIRQRNSYMKDIPHRQDLQVVGLLPPCMLGDYALPTCDWHWYYVDNALALQGVQRFADAVADFDAELGKKYHAEAEAFRRDLRRAVEREAILSPVRRGRDGKCRTYLPRMAYARGLTGPELEAPQFPDVDWFMGALPLAEPFCALDAADPRMADTQDVMEEMATSAEAIRSQEEARKQKGLPTADAWFWCCVGTRLPKASHNANIFLLRDDVPNFLRYWMNSYAAMTGANGKLWEHGHLGSYADCDNPDNGTAGWFLENFRDLLVMEDGKDLWLARGTPRVWLEQGKKIAVSNAPTYFGPVAYRIESDVAHGKINAALEMPNRNAPQTVLLRFRHPQSAAIKSVTVNGKAWTDFDACKEVIRLRNVSGSVKVQATY